jgi:hypothetical protein
MTDEIKRTLHGAVLRLLRPLVRLLLHHSVPYETFADLARWVYVDVAEKEFTLEGKKQTTSRISVITGLNRKEVARLQAMTVEDNTAAIASFNRAEKVITAWRHDYPKADSSNHVAALPLEGENSFATLVKRYSGDMPTRAVLDELLRVGVVRKLGRDEIELVSNDGVLVPGAENRNALLTGFGEDTSDFMSTISNNILNGDKHTFLQQRAWSDNLPVEKLDVIKAISSKRGQEIIAEFVEQFSKLDRDITPNVGGSGRARALFGVYYYQEVIDAESESKKSSARKRQ